MCVLDDILHQLLGVDHAILVRDHPTSKGENGAGYTNIEQNGATGRDLEMKERVRVDERKQNEDGSE